MQTSSRPSLHRIQSKNWLYQKHACRVPVLYTIVGMVDEEARSKIDSPAVALCVINLALILFSQTLTCITLDRFGPYCTRGRLSHQAHQLNKPCTTYQHHRVETQPVQVCVAGVILYDRAAHRLWDTVKSCHFQGQDCTAEDFESVSNPWFLTLNYNPFSSLLPQANVVCKRCLGTSLYAYKIHSTKESNLEK